MAKVLRRIQPAAPSLILALERYVAEITGEAQVDPLTEHLAVLGAAGPFVAAVRDLEERRERTRQDLAAFADDHPELTEPGPVTDDEVIEALRAAIDAWDGYLAQHQPWREAEGAVSASDVAEMLFPGRTYESGRPSGVTLRVAKTLARMARDGRVVRLRPKWGGSSGWSLPGVTVGSFPLRGRVIDDA
jgi:hypothetical protein